MMAPATTLSPRTAAHRRDPGSTHPPHEQLHDGPRLKAGVTVEKPIDQALLSLPSWSRLARPSTSLPATTEPRPSELVDGRTKSDHDDEWWADRVRA